MENQKAVNRLLVGLPVSVLVLSLAISLYLRDFSVVLGTLGFVLLMLAGCAVVSLVFAVGFGPLLWLLSRLSSRGSKPKA